MADKKKKNKHNHNNQNSTKPAKPQEPQKEVAVPVTEEEADSIRVTVDLDDGTSEECSILTILEVMGNEYIALLPRDEKDQPNAEGKVYLYRYYEDEEGLPYIENIEDDDEYEAVFDAFDEWQDDELFDSMPD